MKLGASLDEAAIDEIVAAARADTQSGNGGNGPSDEQRETVAGKYMRLLHVAYRRAELRARKGAAQVAGTSVAGPEEEVLENVYSLFGEQRKAKPERRAKEQTLDDLARAGDELLAGSMQAQGLAADIP